MNVQFCFEYHSTYRGRCLKNHSCVGSLVDITLFNRCHALIFIVRSRERENMKGSDVFSYWFLLQLDDIPT